MERATRCFSELTKGRKQPAYVCKWKHQSKHGASALQGLSPCTLPSTREWCRATEAKSSRERAGTATNSTGQLRVAMGSLTAPLCLFSVGSGPNCGICRPSVGAAATSQPRILPYVGRETMWRHCERLGRSPWRVDASECGIFDVVSNPAGHGAENVAEDARG